ncbi:MAG: hypothetical protein ABGY95_03960 [Rubritalea sp.]|uniref:hypothetical protein n=1 Tax=Rubritalea sp. TaxID=2109375 RepID=UPI003241F1ED
MKNSFSYLLLSALSALVLSSCSVSLTQKQKDAITSVSVLDHSVNKNAQMPINGTEAPSHTHKAPFIYTGDENFSSSAATGTTGQLFKEAADAGMLEVQAKGFQKQYKTELEKMNSVVYPKIAEGIEKRAVAAVKENGFLGGRWAKKSPHYFDGEIIAYGLQRKIRRGEETYLEAVVGIRVWFVSEGKQLFSESIVMRSRNAHTVASYVENPELLRTVFEEAGNNFSVQFEALLDKRFGK